MDKNKIVRLCINKAEHAVQSYAAGIGGKGPRGLWVWGLWGRGWGQGSIYQTSFRPQAMLMSNYTAFWTKRQEEEEEEKEKEEEEEENGGSKSCRGLGPAAKKGTHSKLYH